MKAWTNFRLQIGITIFLFVYAFVQPSLTHDGVGFPLRIDNINTFAFAMGFLSLYFDVIFYRRIKDHYKHIKFNLYNEKCRDCIQAKLRGELN